MCPFNSNITYYVPSATRPMKMRVDVPSNILYSSCKRNVQLINFMLVRPIVSNLVVHCKAIPLKINSMFSLHEKHIQRVSTH